MKRNGFTLVEMLVALAVFAVIAGGALVLLRFSVDAEIASRDQTQRIAAQRRFVAIWTADLAQASPRPVRGPDGSPRPALTTGEDGALLTLTRSGWDNPAGEPRPSLQRVAWRVQDGALVRAGHPFPDGASAPEPSAMVRVAATPRLRFREPGGQWRDRWDPEKSVDLPTAIELLLPQEDGTDLRIVAPVGANYQ